MSTRRPEPLTYEGGSVEPGETAHLRYPITQSYLGDPPCHFAEVDDTVEAIATG